MDRAASLTALFHDLVRSAMDAQRVPRSDTVEHYLVALLEAFARPCRTDLLDPPLAIDYLAADHCSAAQRYEKLKRVADTALFIAGIFPDSLERSAVGPSYYSTLGRSAFVRLSHDPCQTSRRVIFGELAQRFADCLNVLTQISDDDLFHRDRDTLRLYERWLASGSGRDAATLVRRGVIPAPSGSRSTRRH